MRCSSHGDFPVRIYSALGTMLAKDPYCEVYKAVFARAMLRKRVRLPQKPAPALS